MPAKYKLVLRRDMRKGAEKDAKLYYANAKAAGTVDIKELCDLIAEGSTASPGDVKLILDELIRVMRRSLGKGEVVQVGELGNFQLLFGSTGTLTEKEFNSTLIKQVSGTNKEAYDACTALAYGRIYHTNMVTQIQIAGFKILGTILKEYTDAVLKPETYYARNILSIMPEQYKVSKEDSMYTKIQTVVDYVSGMTDSYALNLYRKIKGIDLPEIK